MPPKVVVFPAETLVPNEMLTSQAKDRISDVVKKATAGGRTTIMSRGYGVAVIGPLSDVPSAFMQETCRLPVTEIKSGQTSIKGIIARYDFAILTVHGEPRAAVYRPKVLAQKQAGNEDKLAHLIGLLEDTAILNRENAKVRNETRLLKGLLKELTGKIEAGLKVLEKIDKNSAHLLRKRYLTLTGK